jgi:putative N-acetylmannosamine-6-phosphate epimerase
LFKEAMQGVVAALAAAAQKGGAEGLFASVLGDAVSAATQSATPVVQQSQFVATGSQQVLPMQVDA